MRKVNQEISDQDEIEEILKSARVCRIAFHDDPYPYILPFNFGYSDNCIFIHCAAEGKKIDLISRNNQVCIEAEERAEVVESDDPCGWTTRYRSVIGFGKAEIITGAEDKKIGLDIIMDQHGFRGRKKYSKGPFSEMVIVKIQIENLTAKRSSRL